MSYGSTQDHMSYDPERHDSQMVAVYETMARAEAARSALLAAGIPASEVQVIDGASSGDTGTTHRTTGQDEGFWGAVKNLFAPEDDYNTYHSALGRGHAMVAVTPTNAADRERIMRVLEDSDPVDMDAKRDEWQSDTGEGMSRRGVAGMVPNTASSGAPTGMAEANPGFGRTAAGTEARANATGTGSEDTIKVVQERLRVGKREVAHGAVRVRSYVVERPVDEQVSLHQEKISVDRRPVDKPVTGDAANLFQERTLEARATSEEAVVEKEARIVEEIGLRKEASDRTETVHDTVRETKVEVDDNGNRTAGARTGTDTAQPATSSTAKPGTNPPRT